MLALAPFLIITAVHLACLGAGADVAGDVTQVMLMPALALGLWVLLKRGASSTTADTAGLATFTLWALFFSWLGDSVPRFLDGDPAFIAMVGFFLIGQVCYIRAFWPWAERSVLHNRPLCAPYVVAAIVLLAFTVPAAGVLAPAVVVYGVTLVAMGVLATGLNVLTWIGGVIFIVSDALIALDAFDVWTPPAHDIAVMTTYCAAQLLLVLGVVRLSSDHDDQQRPGVPSRPGPRLAG